MIVDANGQAIQSNGSGAAANVSEADFRVNRVSFAQSHGFQYDGERDIYAVAGYKNVLHFRDFWDMYRRGGIARRIIDMPVDTSWRRTPELTEGEDQEDTEFTGQFKALADRRELRWWSKISRADRLASIGRFGVLLIGVRNEDDLAEPMGTLQGPEAVAYLTPYKEGDVRILKWEQEEGNPRFGEPLTYEIDLAGALAESGASLAATLRRQQVHWTRVIHIAQDLIDDEVYGLPKLEAVFNRLYDLEKIAACSAEAFWQNVTRILQAKIHQDAKVGPDQLQQMDTQLREIYHDLRRTFYGQGAELEWLSAENPRPKEAADLVLMLIAAASGIPKRILFGSETGERASTEDQKQWLGSVRERQQNVCEPVILRPLIDRLVDHGALTRPASGYEVEWPELFEVPDEQKAEANLKRAQAVKSLTPVGGDPLELVEITEDRDIWPIPQTPEEAEARRRENQVAMPMPTPGEEPMPEDEVPEAA